MEKLKTRFIFSVILLLSSVTTVNSINCFHCSGTNSNDPFECNENLSADTDLAPIDCGALHNAQYCIKHTGRFEGYTIDCYQCNSSSNMECGDGLMNLDGGILRETPCDHVYNALHCIKQIGGISTKRYCSSLDLGNYCNYVRQPGDKLEYRTCIFTCSSDGCNGAAAMKISVFLVLSLITTCLFA